MLLIQLARVGDIDEVFTAISHLSQHRASSRTQCINATSKSHDSKRPKASFVLQNLFCVQWQFSMIVQSKHHSLQGTTYAHRLVHLGLAQIQAQMPCSHVDMSLLSYLVNLSGQIIQADGEIMAATNATKALAKVVKMVNRKRKSVPLDNRLAASPLYLATIFFLDDVVQIIVAIVFSKCSRPSQKSSRSTIFYERCVDLVATETRLLDETYKEQRRHSEMYELLVAEQGTYKYVLWLQVVLIIPALACAVISSGLFDSQRVTFTESGFLQQLYTFVTPQAVTRQPSGAFQQDTTSQMLSPSSPYIVTSSPNSRRHNFPTARLLLKLSRSETTYQDLDTTGKVLVPVSLIVTSTCVIVSLVTMLFWRDNGDFHFSNLLRFLGAANWETHTETAAATSSFKATFDALRSARLKEVIPNHSRYVIAQVKSLVAELDYVPIRNIRVAVSSQNNTINNLKLIIESTLGSALQWWPLSPSFSPLAPHLSRIHWQCVS